MNLGGPEVTILLVMFGGVLSFALTVWALIDSQSQPDVAWNRIGQNKIVWLIVLIVGLFACLIGLIASIVYLTTVRPKLQAAGPTLRDL